ncbi:hypothetical protein [Solidesulfovibrio carbinolicus]|uniref:Phage tail assembly protein n=1 Tax=Solidesulfovibrio carbinolicus TaxID=296842 RepID=A0A4P6HMI8_9BACT|nr:hypothetical protein [Solidesulfovibrio carbinolicus]QAZ68255.1 hypothetical protein C3Y92_13900 [Solidesulfovibrio carbinolicus]
MVTVEGTLHYGYTDSEGNLHTRFEMRMPTLDDMEWAIEQAPEKACTARLSRYVWSRTLTRLGELTAEQITPELLAGLHYSEYSVLESAEGELQGKLKPANVA